jgi:hypothetical protein
VYHKLLLCVCVPHPPVVLTLLGWTRGDVIGEPLDLLFPSPLSTSLLHYMQDALVEGVHVRACIR